MHLKTKPSTYKTNARGHLTEKEGPGNIQQGERGLPHHKNPKYEVERQQEGGRCT